ncbi:slit homolog 2 protein-like [Polistes fuscatus]|uniref:slit homolog 2 protein-like n=1 Tax=Polistes fuscatus TaxID=30207 RepID=UPI001CAA16DA|nr:slit homolog 2 protein-like [Polistes fuscatus]
MGTMTMAMLYITISTFLALFVQVNCKCSLTPIVNGERSIAYACTDSELSDLDEISNEAEWIEFSVSRIRIIPDDAFLRFRGLKRLSFYNCHVDHIAPHAFRGLHSLDWLIFHGTKLHVARTTWFQHLPNLRKLILDRCGIFYIEAEVFRTLPRLEILSLYDNELDCIPIDELAPLRSLRNIRIDGNPWLCECRRKLERFFRERRIMENVGIEEKVMPVHKSWRQCMENINIFVISRHPTNPNIKILEEGDKFQTSTLRSLDRLPDKTSWIELSGLRLDKIPSYAFYRFGNTLRSLEFRNCIIGNIEANAFAGLYKLERLSFVDNELPQIETNWFRDLVNLHRLIIARNEIEHIREYTFWHLRNNLKYLDIRENRLRCLPIDEIERLTKLERLDAIGNPWNCNCRRNLEKTLTKLNVGFEISAGRCYDDDNQIPSIIEERRKNQTTTVTTSVIGNVHWASFEDSLNKDTNVSVLIPATTMMTTIQEEQVTQQPTTEFVYTNIITTSRPTTHKGTCTLDNNSQQVYTCTGLTSISPVNSIDSRAHTIRITLSDISVIPPESFQRFNGYLRRLEFRDCGIEKIAAGAFAGLYNLEYLSIRNNALKSFTSEYLVGLSSSLRYLDLSRNRISRIDNDVFDLFPHLISFDISENLMNCIGIEHLEHRSTYLKSFEVTGNPWSCLCGVKLAEFLEKRNLPYDKNSLIDRSECYGTHEPSSTVLPTTPSVTPIPTWIIPSTTEEEIPKTIEGVCTSHRKGNNELRYVCTGGNILLFNAIPNEVTAIEFHEGHLPRFPTGTMSKFPNLRELLIRNSGLRIIEPKAFEGYNELKVLAIQDNPLTGVDGSWLNLKQLERLDLRGNSIRYIAPQSFRHLPKLQYLNLEGNDLKCIFTSDLNEMPEVYIIEFSGNPLKWKCRLELEQFLEMRKIKFVRIEESCEGKKYMRNVLWLNKTDTYYTDECQACSLADQIKFSLMLPTFIIYIFNIVRY